MRYLRTKDAEILLDQVHATLARLPSLNDLTLDGALSDGEFPLEFGSALEGDFHGALRLHMGLAHRDVFNMLTNIPTGLHFTKVDIVMDGKFFSDAVKLVEACKDSLQSLRFVPQGESVWSHYVRSCH